MQAGKDIESAYWELVVKDIQDACKLFEPIYNQTDAADGYVSVEVSPRLADDTQGTVDAAKWLHKKVDRSNVYIKIPATAPCIPSIKEVIASGISVNVTVSGFSIRLDSNTSRNKYDNCPGLVAVLILLEVAKINMRKRWASFALFLLMLHHYGYKMLFL